MLKIVDFQSTTAAWTNRPAMRSAIALGKTGLRPNDLENSDVDTWIGRVDALDDCGLGPWSSRNNAIAKYCLEQGDFIRQLNEALKLYSPARVGLILGSSTSSIDRTEAAYRHLDGDGRLQAEYHQPKVHNPGALSIFVSDFLALQGPSLLINTACSSSAKVFASAQRWLDAGIVDAVLVGGADSLGYSIIHGFNALQLLSSKPCKPLDSARDGINIGEAAGFALLARMDTELPGCGVVLKGYGESSDAYHMSHPHPEGAGARASMAAAVDKAGVTSDSVDYINLHGTASQANDTIEAAAVQSIFPESTLCSSTKAWMGHTLGAAGITEALVSVQSLIDNIVPASMNLTTLDERIKINIPRSNQPRELSHVMTNSFGFGGSNCSLLFGRA